MREFNIRETYLNILQNIHSQAKARAHIDELVSDIFPMDRGVRQGYPISLKLFTYVKKIMFKEAYISEGINVDGEQLTNLRFTDGVVLFNEKKQPNKW